MDHQQQKLILRCHLALGDLVCFTAAVKELHRQHPGKFLTDVRTPFGQLWENNPDITPISDDDPDARIIECHYDKDPYVSVHRSNQHSVHIIEGYCQDLANNLGLPPLRPQELKGHIYLSPKELGWMSMPHERYGVQRYWVLSLAGGKKDFTSKWYVPEYAQRIVDYFRGRIQFVQVGSVNNDWNWFPDLQGVIDLRGQTDVRQLIRVIHAASGVLCGVTSHMHLAAAVPLPGWQHRQRPCVVVAGGRESRTWYGYPTHRILETVGQLQCRKDGGCWVSRTIPLSDGKDDGRYCHRVISGHPKCMWSIRPESVILAIESYLDTQGVE